MRNAFVLAKKDFQSYFHSWTGVLMFFFFLITAGSFFSLLVLSYAKISLDAVKNAFQGVDGIGLTRFVFGSFFMNTGVVLIFLVPLLSMRAFAEERRHETLELLFTYPLSDFDVVFGKFLGLIWFFELLVLPTVAYVFFIHNIGGALDWWPIAVGYLGFWLLGNSYLSLGLFISSISESPIVSAVITFSLLLIFWILDWAVGVSDGLFAKILASVSPLAHFREFTVGVMDLKNLAYFLFFQGYFLFLTMRSIETRNWKS